jgi:hypothetical protein
MAEVNPRDYPKYLEYDCGCYYKITNVKGPGSFILECENLCQEHDFTWNFEEDEED